MPIPLELLAPAGNREAFAAAVEAGADSVYLGLPRFNARQRAANFSPADLYRAIRIAHERKRRVYVTLNTLVRERGLAQAAEDFLVARDAGADAVIVQDLGLIRIARHCCPELPLHASTQMSIHNAWGVRALEELGFKRVILARECTLEEIRRIGRGTSLGLEVFAHGALCFSVSGQCLFSSFLGGKSANRGRCTQPCRRGFGIGGRQEAPFSMGDLSLVARLDALSAAGVGTIKIEGRQRSAEYVHTVVTAYRRVLDASDAGRAEAVALSVEELSRDHGRAKTEGYLRNPRGKGLVEPARTVAAGVFLGTVDQVAGGRATLHSAEELAAGDRVRVVNRFQERPAFALRSVEKGRAAGGRTAWTFPVPPGVKAGDLAFRTATGRRRRFARWFAEKDKEMRPPDFREAARDASREASRQSRGLFPAVRGRAASLRRIELLEGVPRTQQVRQLPAADLIVPALDGGTRQISGKARKRLILSLPPLTFESEARVLERKVEQLVRAGYRRWMIRGLGHFALLARFPAVEIYADTELGVLNSLAAAALLEMGARSVAVSLETDAENLRQLLGGGKGAAMEWVCHARPALFNSRVQLPGGRNRAVAEGGKRDGRFLLSADRHGLTVRPERAVSGMGIVDRHAARMARFLRVQLAGPDLTRERLRAILESVDRWKPVPRTATFNLGSGANLH